MPRSLMSVGKTDTSTLKIIQTAHLDTSTSDTEIFVLICGIEYYVPEHI